MQQHLRLGHRRSDDRMLQRLCLFLLLSLIHVLIVSAFSLRHDDLAPERPLRGLTQPPELLEVFQVNRPPLTPEELAGATSCSITLMRHDFGNSAGMPYQGELRYQNFSNWTIGTFSPICGTEWDIAVLNLSVISYGRQFDRLGVSGLYYSVLIDNRAFGSGIPKYGEHVRQNRFGPGSTSLIRKTLLTSHPY
jgi:Peptide N-acetyl-beta-D-glucosaminyl asparaginase amidase A